MPRSGRCRSSADCFTDIAGKGSPREEKEFLQPRYARAGKSSRWRGKDAENPDKIRSETESLHLVGSSHLKMHRFRVVGIFPT